MNIQEQIKKIQKGSPNDIEFTILVRELVYHKLIQTGHSPKVMDLHRLEHCECGMIAYIYPGRLDTSDYLSYYIGDDHHDGDIRCGDTYPKCSEIRMRGPRKSAQDIHDDMVSSGHTPVKYFESYYKCDVCGMLPYSNGFSFGGESSYSNADFIKEKPPLGPWRIDYPKCSQLVMMKALQ